MPPPSKLIADGSLEQLTEGISRRLSDQLTSTQLADQLAGRLADSQVFVDRVAYTVFLETLLHGAVGQAPHEVFRNVSDDFWFWALTEGHQRKTALRDLLPGMPPDEIQTHYTGLSGSATLKEAFDSYRTFKQLYKVHTKRELATCEAVLDLGCGWGRIIRFFLKDLEPSRLYGADPVPDLIELCQRSNPWCQFQRIDYEPPWPFADNHFDLVYSFSVFSHLDEDHHKLLLRELRRVLKPGGLLMVTTQGREFITFCEDVRNRTDPNSVAPAVAASLVSFPDTRQALQDYDRGEFCFSPLFPIAGTNYSWGDTALSEAYVKQHWAEDFTFLDYLNDRQRCSQNVIVVKK